MKSDREKFIRQVTRSIERIAKKHDINMWAQQIAEHDEPVEHGIVGVTHFVIFSGAEPSEKDIAASEYDLPLSTH